MFRQIIKKTLGLLIALVLIFVPNLVLAGPGLPFGGQIIKVVPCVCSVNFLIINRPIGPTAQPLLLFEPSSILYAFYNIFTPGTFILGTYTNPSACVILTSDGCQFFSPGFRIHMVGTS